MKRKRVKRGADACRSLTRSLYSLICCCPTLLRLTGLSWQSLPRARTARLRQRVRGSRLFPCLALSPQRDTYIHSLIPYIVVAWQCTLDLSEREPFYCNDGACEHSHPRTYRAPSRIHNMGSAFSTQIPEPEPGGVAVWRGDTDVHVVWCIH